ncbi:MAG: alanine/ornithine racemase family PLP-dependent enzyme [Clostridiales bacterium]|nr:alanine/ornithine racemase family PLP-dependent enzyme [Clostridiales bacterium]
MSQGRYPKLVVDLSKLRHNIERVQNMCQDNGVEIAGVIKGCTGLLECAQQFDRAGCKFIASSRLEQIEPLKGRGIAAPLMMIRVPMLSEVEEVVRLTDISLNSEVEVLKALNRQAGIQDKEHKVILMADLGDLREGFWDKDELLETALMVENDMYNLKLAGVGTNLGCYGAVAATSEKLQELVSCAEAIEEKIGRELEFVSGGATSSLPRIIEGTLPSRINLLRVGEGILLAKDLQELWGYDMSYLYKDAFVVRAEVIEVKNKPSHPVGEIMFDAFGNQPTYNDRGMRTRALLGLGKVDYGFPEDLVPMEDGIEVLGASSDHTILDIEDAGREIKVGDTVDFRISYSNIVYLTNSGNMERTYI